MSQETANSQESDGEDDWLLSCRCNSAKAISTLLSCLDHQEQSSSGAKTSATTTAEMTQSKGRRGARSQRGPQIVTVFCNPKCLTFHVHGTSKQFQASVDINASWFVEYDLAKGEALEAEQGEAEPGGEFCVNLTSVLECLHVLGTSLDAKACFSYNASQEYLKMELFLENYGILATSTVPGMVPPDHDDDDDDDNTMSGHGLHLAFRSSPTVARMIVKSETLQQIVPELEPVTGATQGTVAINQSQGLQIAVVGHLGECIASIPSVGDHVVMLEIEKEGSHSISNFPLHSLMASFRGLEMSNETCITMTANGMMAIQHQVLLESPESDEQESTPCFVEFILCGLTDEEDDEDDNNNDAGTYGESHRSRALIQSQIRDDYQSYQSSSSPVQPARSIAASTAGSTTEASRKRAPPSPLSQDDPDGADEEQEDESSPPPPASANPLFQSLVDSSLSKSPDDQPNRRQRRRFGKRHSGQSDRYQRRARDDSEDDSKADDASSGAMSHGLLASDKDDDDDDDDYRSARRGERRHDVESSRYEESQPDFSQPLDVTAPASSRRGEDDEEEEEDSDPEIVYGPQH